MRAVEAASRILFSDSAETASIETIQTLAREVPTTEIGAADFESGIGLVDLLLRSRMAESKGAARRLIDGGGVYLYSERQNSVQKMLTTGDLKWPGALLLRAGKKNFHLVRIGKSL